MLNSKVREFLLLLGFILMFLQFKLPEVIIIKYSLFFLGVLFWCDVAIQDSVKRKHIIIILGLLIYGLIFLLQGKGSVQFVAIYIPFSFALYKTRVHYPVLWISTATLIAVQVAYDWSLSPNQYYLYKGMSRNYVSVFALYCLLIVATAYKKRKRECPLLPAIVAWLMSVSAFGRGGIISSSIVLALFAYKWGVSKVYVRGNKHYKREALVILGLSFLLIYGYSKMDYLEANYFRRFFGYESSYTNSNSVRMGMILEYIKYCYDHSLAFFFGADGTSFSSATSNLHNSFLQVHSQFGFFGLLFLLTMICNSVIVFFKKKELESLILLSGILIRGATDWCFPAFPLDIFLLMLFFSAMWDSNVNRNMMEEYIYGYQKIRGQRCLQVIDRC